MLSSDRLLWKRCSPEPLIRPHPGTIASEGVTTPDVIFRDGRHLLYVGAVDSGRERIIVFPFNPHEFIHPHPLTIPASAKIALSAGPNSFDDQHVFDPAALGIGDKVYLYYSAIGQRADCIGLAVSADSIDFKKVDSPLLIGRSPEIILHQGIFFLYYVLKSDLKGYEIYYATADDGKSFKPQGFALCANEGENWDSFEVTTPRIFQYQHDYYMIYAGSDSSDRKDLPTGFGLARSADLLHWEKYPHNPVFEIGKTGAWDDGAIWFGTVFESDNYLYLIYEGGRLPEKSVQSPAFTEVGLARIETMIFDRIVSKW